MQYGDLSLSPLLALFLSQDPAAGGSGSAETISADHWLNGRGARPHRSTSLCSTVFLNFQVIPFNNCQPPTELSHVNRGISRRGKLPLISNRCVPQSDDSRTSIYDLVGATC